MHGGAGREGAEERAPRRAGVARAVEVGWEVLARGGSALEAVIEAVVVLEDDPHFNAGLGSVLTVEGTPLFTLPRQRLQPVGARPYSRAP